MDELDEYVQAANRRYFSHAKERVGQAFFNELHERHPDVANAIRGTIYDPFHWQDPFDPRFHGFFAVVEAKLR